MAVAGTRCLLIGAGTLGCAVARCLLGWGVRTISFVDSGVVSYSNPVRQSLFNFEDCVGGETPKAQAAADALRRIFPSVNASAHRIGIPMPGHPVGPNEAEQVQRDVAQLEALVQSHDIVYLLTDTRESRWLPTLLATVHRKLTITVALGFDALVVMRHGIPPPDDPTGSAPGSAPGSALGSDPGSASTGSAPTSPGPPPAPGIEPSRLGCYFCNDVVAPANSMLRRTLDQQCTVSRPGLSMIASALSVELMVTLLHHPAKGMAETDLVGTAAPASSDSPLGCVPHQIRATLPLFRTECMAGRAFDRCTACSPTVTSAYAGGGFGFCMAAFNQPSFLEDLTGLTQMHAETEAALEGVDLFDDDDEDF